MAIIKRCNLCLKRAQMTEDHLFPRGLVSPGQRQVKKMLHKIDPNYRGRQGTALVQNGLKASTLCADCNNRVLGSDLDPSLIAIHKAASAALQRVRYPVTGTLDVFRINLNKAARAVAGHLLALDDKAWPRRPLERYLRRFVLQEGTGLHHSLRFHMWLYPYTRQGIFKDLHHVELDSTYDPLWVSAFKTYPLAFAFTTVIANPIYRLGGMLDLTEFVNSGPEAQFDMRIKTRPLVDSNWPFAPHRDGMIMAGENGSIVTAPFLKTKKV